MAPELHPEVEPNPTPGSMTGRSAGRMLVTRRSGMIGAGRPHGPEREGSTDG